MNGTMSKARQNAEKAFEKTQTTFDARTRAYKEHDAQNSDRAEKTRRLKAARLERDLSGASSRPPAKVTL